MSKRKQDDVVNDLSGKHNKSGEQDDSNSKGSTFVVTVVNDSIQGMQEWTEEETALLKQAVDTDGGQFNWDVIGSCVPSKDINQVKTYVLSMVSQSQEGETTSQSPNVIKAPIEIWTDLAQKLTSGADKAAAICIPQLMVAAAAEPANVKEPGSPNYSQIYLYLSSILKDETPPSLPPLESSIILSLIQEIVNKIRSSELSGQIHFLSSTYKNFKSSNDDNGKAKKTAEAERGSVSKKPDRISSKGKAKRNQESASDSDEYTPARKPRKKTSVDKRPERSVTRTSSGRVVRQRFQIVISDSDDDEDELTEIANIEKDAEKSSSDVAHTPKPTSLNPFRIPVNLLNFRPAQTKKKV